MKENEYYLLVPKNENEYSLMGPFPKEDIFSLQRQIKGTIATFPKEEDKDEGKKQDS